MPKRRKGESSKRYASRCISYVMRHEGLSQSHAIGKCMGMAGLSKRKTKKKSRKKRKSRRK